MTTLNEGIHATESLISEAPGTRSREKIIVVSAAVITACMVLGAVETGVPTATAGAPFSVNGSTVGNGAVSAVSADAGAMEGTWQVEITGAAGATAAFLVRRPNGTVDGVGNVGTAYNGTRSINFTVADGATDYGAGHVIPIVVAYKDADSVLKYEPLDPAGTDGSQIAAAIAYGDYDATDGDVPGVAWVRDCEHNADIVKWPSGITADQKAVAIRQLAAVGITLR